MHNFSDTGTDADRHRGRAGTQPDAQPEWCSQCSRQYLLCHVWVEEGHVLCQEGEAALAGEHVQG